MDGAMNAFMVVTTVTATIMLSMFAAEKCYDIGTAAEYARSLEQANGLPGETLLHRDCEDGAISDFIAELVTGYVNATPPTTPTEDTLCDIGDRAEAQYTRCIHDGHPTRLYSIVCSNSYAILLLYTMYLRSIRSGLEADVFTDPMPASASLFFDAVFAVSFYISLAARFHFPAHVLHDYATIVLLVLVHAVFVAYAFRSRAQHPFLLFVPPPPPPLPARAEGA